MRAYSVSLWIFGLCALTVLMTPVSMRALAGTSPEVLHLVPYVHVLLSDILGLASVFFGLAALRRRRRVLLWLIPAALWVLLSLPVLWFVM